MSEVEEEAASVRPAISMLKFPFKLTKDQIEAVRIPTILIL
jgi:hypothetical protein